MPKGFPHSTIYKHKQLVFLLQSTSILCLNVLQSSYMLLKTRCQCTTSRQAKQAHLRKLATTSKQILQKNFKLFNLEVESSVLDVIGAISGVVSSCEILTKEQRKSSNPVLWSNFKLKTTLHKYRNFKKPT